MRKLYIWWFCSFAIALIQFIPLTHSKCGLSGTIIACSNMLAGSISNEVEVFDKATGNISLYLKNLEWQESKIVPVGFLPNTTANIVELRIKGGNFTFLMNGIFANEIFMQLETLELYNLPLNDLPQKLYKFTPLLKTLSIRNLTITYIQLPNMPSLTDFRVIDCAALNVLNISNLMQNAELPKLKEMLFSRNNIQNTITENTFSEPNNIELLYLENNKIESIPGNAFAKLSPSIKTLSLASNELKTLPDSFFSILNRLENKKVIDLSNNPFECGCDIQNIKTFIMEFEDKFSNIPCCVERKKFCTSYILIKNMFNYNCGKLDKNRYKSLIDINCYSSNNNVLQKNVSTSRLLRIKSESIDKYLNTTKYPSNYSILYFEDEFLIDDFNDLTRRKCKLNNITNRDGHVQQKLLLKSNHLHQFCMTKNELPAVSPHECILFYTKPEIRSAVWISAKYRAIAIPAWTFVGAITFSFGIYSSFVVAKRIPKLLGLKVKKPVIIYREKTSNSNHFNETYVRFQQKCVNDRIKNFDNEPEYAYVISSDPDYIVLENNHRNAPPIPQRRDKKIEYIEVIN